MWCRCLLTSGSRLLFYYAVHGHYAAEALRRANLSAFAYDPAAEEQGAECSVIRGARCHAAPVGAHIGFYPAQGWREDSVAGGGESREPR